jgi:hypothetical protein
VSALLQRIEVLVSELRFLEHRGAAVAAKERELERLRWRLAAVVRKAEATA